MKGMRNIKKIFQTIAFTFTAFFIFGAVSVNAKTVSVDRASFLVKFSDKTSDVIQLSSDVDLSDLTTRYAIYIYKDKTIDLNGYDLTITERGIALWYYKNATVRFIDSSNAKSGKIIREHKDGSMFADSLIGISNEDVVNATDTFLVFDGVKIYREVDNNSIKVIAPESTATDKRINKVSFINTDITNFLGLNDGREAKDFYYENVTFKRGVVNQGFLLNSSTKTVNDVISDNSEIIKESYTGTYKSTFDRNTEMSSVKTSDDVIKVRYIKGVSVSNVNFDPLNYKESPVSKNITITNSGQEDITITNVSVSSPDFVVTGSSSVTLSSGSTDNTSWSIRPKDELGGGTYVATITVTAGDKTYTSIVTLTVKEVDSEGKDVVYVTTTDELSSAINARTKTIKLANDLNYNNGWFSIPVYGDTTIDLNGKTIYTRTGNFGLNYQDAATIKIIDSSNAKTGRIVENGVESSGTSGIIQLVNNVTDTAKECSFIIDGVTITSEYVRSDAMIAVGGDNSLKNVKLVNSLFSNYQYVLDGRNIDKITFENVKATSTEYQRIYLVGMKSGLTFGDITSDDSEVVYLEADGRYIRDASKDTLVNSDSLIKGQSIQVRYKSGFNVTTESKTINYKDSTTYYPINITNRGTSGLNITNVTIDDTNNFEVNTGNSGIIDAGKTDTSWSIKVKNGITLKKGVYTVNISVLGSDTITYKGTFALIVNPKPLSNLGIDGVPSEITYGDTITPTINGDDSNELSVSDYEISYLVEEGETYVSIDEPKNVGKYKAVFKVTNENYSFGEASVDFEIIPLTITPSVGLIPPVRYTGNKLTPVFNVWNGSEMLIADTDYRYTFSNNINAGKGKLTINPISGRNYTFTAFDAEFDILRKGLDSSDITVTLPNTSYKYTGGEINPIPVVKDGDKELVLGTDYSLSYEGDITSIGTTTAKVVVSGIGNYQNVVKVSFDIIAKDSQEISFNESNITKTYGDGSFTIIANHTKGDGTVKYTSTNTDVADVNETSGSVTIKGAGTVQIKATADETEDYGEGVATYTLTIAKKEISINRAAVNGKEYDGTKTAKVNYVIFNGLIYGDNLEQDVDYTATAEFDSESIGYSKPVTIKVVLKDTAKANNYKLKNNEYQTRSTISGKSIKEDWITLDKTSYIYNGSSIEPVVTIKDSTGETVITLTKGTHYTVEYSDNLNAGTGKIKITGIGNYAGLIEKEFTINKKSITPTIEDIAAVTYSGRAHTPLLVVKDGSTTLVKGTDYTVEYTNNLRAGQGYAEISEVSSSNYTFTSVVKNFTINKYQIKASDVTLEYTSVVFDNNAKKPSVTVKMGSEVIPPIEYNVDYSNNTNVGTATVKVTIKADSDDFTGEVTKNFEIVSKTLLTISGISNQQVTYTGSPVKLVGTLQVSNGISPSSLTEKWYKDGAEISKPTNVGVYKVVYSYEDDNYIGSLTIDFEIIKKISTVPSVNSYKGVVGDKLSTITLPDGFKWVDSNETIIAGNKEYSATYTTNNDEANYTTETTVITVYGKSKVNLNTSVNGIGGTISFSKINVLEGTTETIIFTPNTGFEISKVEVNGVDKTSSVANNKLDVVLGNNDVNVVVTYKVIEYTITINGVANATINPSGIIKVNYNTDKEFTIKADNGYKLVSVKVNGVERISDIANDKLTLENILADAEIVVVVQKNLYEVIEGANQKYTITKNNEAKFKIDADYIKFENGGKVYVDDVLVDQANYTSESGSTIITLKKEFVDNLSVGDHTLRVEFVDGEAATTFIVDKSSIEENPKTGDNIGAYIVSSIVSALGLTGASIYFYKRKQTN